jgi:hypothetical protein
MTVANISSPLCPYVLCPCANWFRIVVLYRYNLTVTLFEIMPPESRTMQDFHGEILTGLHNIMSKLDYIFIKWFMQAWNTRTLYE